jgi:hypothetical protein
MLECQGHGLGKTPMIKAPLWSAPLRLSGAQNPAAKIQRYAKLVAKEKSHG